MAIEKSSVLNGFPDVSLQRTRYANVYVITGVHRCYDRYVHLCEYPIKIGCDCMAEHPWRLGEEPVLSKLIIAAMGREPKEGAIPADLHAQCHTDVQTFRTVRIFSFLSLGGSLMGKNKRIIYYIDHTDIEVLVTDPNHREDQDREDKLDPSVIAYRDPRSRLVTGMLLSTDFTDEHSISDSLLTNTPTEESEGL